MTQPPFQQTTGQREPQPPSNPPAEQEAATFAPPKPNTGGNKPVDTLGFSLAPTTTDDEPEDPNSGQPKPPDTLGFSARVDEANPPPCAPEKPNTGNGKAGDALSFTP